MKKMYLAVMAMTMVAVEAAAQEITNKVEKTYYGFRIKNENGSSRNTRWTTGETKISLLGGYSTGVSAPSFDAEIQRQYTYWSLTGQVGHSHSSTYGGLNNAALLVGVNTRANRKIFGSLYGGFGVAQMPTYTTYVNGKGLTNYERTRVMRPALTIAAGVTGRVAPRWSVGLRVTYQYAIPGSLEKNTGGDWMFENREVQNNVIKPELVVSYTLSQPEKKQVGNGISGSQVSGDKCVRISAFAGWSNLGAIYGGEIGHSKRFDARWGRYLAIGTTFTSKDAKTSNEVYVKGMAEFYPIGKDSKVILRLGPSLGLGDYGRETLAKSGVDNGTTLTKTQKDKRFGFSPKLHLDLDAHFGAFTAGAFGAVGGYWTTKTDFVDEANLGYTGFENKASGFVYQVGGKFAVAF